MYKMFCYPILFGQSNKNTNEKRTIMNAALEQTKHGAINELHPEAKRVAFKRNRIFYHIKSRP